MVRSNQNCNHSVKIKNQSAFQSTSLTCLAVFPSKTWITFTRVTVYIIDTFTMRATRLACTFVNIWEQKNSENYELDHFEHIWNLTNRLVPKENLNSQRKQYGQG